MLKFDTMGKKDQTDDNAVCNEDDIQQPNYAHTKYLGACIFGCLAGFSFVLKSLSLIGER